jgi:ADP-ribose pyrophosphatase YjhB (NUDIX family)
MTASPPQRPIAATIAAVVRDGRVLLVQRANPPDQGRWAFPGGKIDAGEGVLAAAARELLEETGVRAQPLHVFGNPASRWRATMPPTPAGCRWKHWKSFARDQLRRGRTGAQGGGAIIGRAVAFQAGSPRPLSSSQSRNTRAFSGMAPLPGHTR